MKFIYTFKKNVSITRAPAKLAMSVRVASVWVERRMNLYDEFVDDCMYIEIISYECYLFLSRCIMRNKEIHNIFLRIFVYLYFATC
jgi:hypothetical protein